MFTGFAVRRNDKHTTSMNYDKNMTIWDFYNDTNIFITGGLGFVGKVLTLKLLRSFSNISSINMLIRPKRGQTVDERIEIFLRDEVSLLNRSFSCFREIRKKICLCQLFPSEYANILRGQLVFFRKSFP